MASAGKKQRWPLAALALALAAITGGAAWLIAPLWQPGYRPPQTPLPALQTPPAALQPVEAAIDINTADADALAALPGIGESKAQAIVDYRDEHGPFESLESLAEVPGISARMVQSWTGLVTVGN